MMTISLKTPVSHKGDEVTKITFRKPRARDLASADAVDGMTMKTFAVYAAMAGVPIEVILDIDLEDLQRVTAAAEALLGAAFPASKA